MALETGTYISDLVATNPTSSDPKSQGDDHLRLIKSTLQNTFPNVKGAVTPTQSELNALVGATTTGASIKVTTQTAGDSSTNAASTAFVAATAFSSALPAQTGNAGKFVTTNGTTASWAYAGISTINATLTTSTTLSGTYLYVPVQMASLGQSVTLPAANTLSTGGPQYIIDNTKGGYPVGIRDNTGTLLMAVAPGGEALVALKDNSTQAGVWSITGSNLEPGLITIDNTFSSTYTSTVLAPFVALDNNTSIHFAALSSGFAAFVVDNTGKVLTTPVTVSSTASSAPLTAFKVSATSAIVFFGSSTTDNQIVVLTVSGTSPSLSLAVGTPATFAASMNAGCWDGENFIGAPKIVQLSSTLYLAGLTIGGATSAVAVSVSGSTVTVGSSVNIITSNTVGGSTTTYALTSTTALVLYKSGAAAPYANNAVVISVSGTTCSVGTPVALASSSATSINDSCLLSSTLALLSSDGNSATTKQVQAIGISGTTVTAGTPLVIENGPTNLNDLYDNYLNLANVNGTTAGRNAPKLYPISATSALLRYGPAGAIPRSVVLSVSGTTVSAGKITYLLPGAGGSGQFGGFALNATDFVALAAYSNSAQQLTPLPIKINGTSLTLGSVRGDIAMPYVSPYNAQVFRTGNGYYVYVENQASQVAPKMFVFSSNGDVFSMKGSISAPPIAGPTSTPPLNFGVSNNRLVVLSSEYWFSSSSSTAQSLRLINVEIAA